METTPSAPVPAGPADTPVVYRPTGAFNTRASVGSVALLVLSAVLLAPAIASGSVGGAIVLAGLVLLAAWALLTGRRQGATLTADELVVRGRLTTTRVRLADVTAVHHQDRRGLVTWVAARGQRPFRIHFVTGRPAFAADVRSRAIAQGARLDGEAEMVAAPPRDTRLFFTLL